MANSIQFNPLAPGWRSLVGPASPSLRDMAKNVPELVLDDQASLLADVQDDMASLLASMVRRQTSRRADKVEDQDNDSHGDVSDGSPKEEVERVRELLRGESARWTVAYDLARNLFPDPTELALLLAGLRDDAELDREIRKEIERTLAELSREHGQERLAGTLNIRRVVASFASRTGLTPAGLREAYRALIESGSGESVTYRYLVDLFGFQRRGLALDFLEQALAADMGAEFPSRLPEDFQPLLALLFQLRLLRSADALLTSAAAQRRQRRHGRRLNKRDDEAPDILDRELVDLLLAALNDVQETRRQFAAFLKRWRSLAGDSPVSEWAHDVLRDMATVPVELFPDLAYRETLLANLSAAIEEIFYPNGRTGLQPGAKYA